MSLTLDKFEAHRPLLFSIAYRMLGSIAEAEDIVQEAYLRYQAVSSEHVESPKAFLTTVVTRLCLDYLKSARVKRETYLGTWLPEPLLTQSMDEQGDFDAGLKTFESISMAFLVLLESLTPIERAVFLLREVFDYSYSEIAEIVGKSEAACRQLFHRARQHIDERRPRFSSSQEERCRLTESFVNACSTGDLDSLMGLLADDITVWADGGGKAAAAIRPITGRERVARFLLGIARKFASELTVEVVEINGGPGLVGYDRGVAVSVVIPDIEGGRIRGLHVIANPDKLAHLQRN